MTAAQRGVVMAAVVVLLVAAVMAAVPLGSTDSLYRGTPWETFDANSTGKDECGAAVLEVVRKNGCKTPARRRLGWAGALGAAGVLLGLAGFFVLRPPRRAAVDTKHTFD